jgi:hypothetical protein
LYKNLKQIETQKLLRSSNHKTEKQLWNELMKNNVYKNVTDLKRDISIRKNINPGMNNSSSSNMSFIDYLKIPINLIC